VSIRGTRERLEQLLAQRFEESTGDAAPRYKEHRIFTNRNIKLGRMQAVGFDMDYTLAQYRQENLERLTMKLALAHLVDDMGYPEEILEIPYSPDFAIRGLIVDTELGNVLKMDKFRYVSLAYHGLKQVEPDERVARYNVARVTPSIKRFRPVDTLFELIETYLYAAIIDCLEGSGKEIAYRKLYEDLRGAIDLCHSDNSLKNAIMADPASYIQEDPKLITALHQFRESGRQLFVLTNSEPEYTDFVLSFLFRDASPYFRGWRSCFDIVGAFAGKPRFFTEGRPPEIIEDREALFFSGGNIDFLEEKLGVQQDQVLYVGDHIYGDILKSKHNSYWRTCLIVPELSNQIQAEEETRETLQELLKNESRHKQLTMEIGWRRNHLQELQQVKSNEADELDKELLDQIDAAIGRLNRQLEKSHKSLSGVLVRSRALRREISSHFNPYWGRLFKTGGQLSMFAEQIRDYACIYTSSVSNFSYYTHDSYLESVVTPMPHERIFYSVGDLNFDSSMEPVPSSQGVIAYERVTEPPA